MLGQIAVMYLSAFAAGVAAFVFCSFWVYHYVDVETDVLVERDEYPEVGPWGVFPIDYS
jgi:amino acid permease